MLVLEEKKLNSVRFKISLQKVLKNSIKQTKQDLTWVDIYSIAILSFTDESHTCTMINAKDLLACSCELNPHCTYVHHDPTSSQESVYSQVNGSNFKVPYRIMHQAWKQQPHNCTDVPRPDECCARRLIFSKHVLLALLGMIPPLMPPTPKHL